MMLGIFLWRSACVGAMSVGFGVLLFSIPTWQNAAAASAAQDMPDLCVAAAQNAADQTGVPLSVLMAITLTETGRATKNGLKPWPWSVNQGGEGYWFASADEAVQFAEKQLDLGYRNFDLGCFQLNHRWHSKGFTSTIDMFDPMRNALYAAGFLADLYSEKGDWSLAAAAYHSRTPDEAERYRAKYDSILAGLTDGPLPQFVDAEPVVRINRFPLLQAGQRGNAGSLVPLISTGTRLIGGQP